MVGIRSLVQRFWRFRVVAFLRTWLRRVALTGSAAVAAILLSGRLQSLLVYAHLMAWPYANFRHPRRTHVSIKITSASVGV